MYLAVMRAAFKEWAVIVDALGQGGQIIILRKGGIHEGRGGFMVDQPRFLLFPTQFHQQRDSVLPAAQSCFDDLPRNLLPPNQLRLEFFAEVALVSRLDSLAAANALRGQHVWRDEVIAERFDWGREKSVFALAVRVFRLTERVDLPMREAYGGCKSWIELDEDIATEGSKPVLTNAAFECRLNEFRAALSLAGSNIQAARESLDSRAPTVATLG